MRYLTIAAGIAALGFFTAPVQADHHMAKAIQVSQTGKGDVLANAQGMTLYIFDKDKTDLSNCYGECATKWPPMAATAQSKDEGDFTVIMRTDGEYQWAYKGHPLYTWFKDTEPGETSGDGVNGVWHLARP